MSRVKKLSMNQNEIITEGCIKKIFYKTNCFLEKQIIYFCIFIGFFRVNCFVYAHVYEH